MAKGSALVECSRQGSQEFDSNFLKTSQKLLSGQFIELPLNQQSAKAKCFIKESSKGSICTHNKQGAPRKSKNPAGRSPAVAGPAANFSCSM